MLRNIFLIVVTLFIAIFPFQESVASHAAGFDLQYECLGNGQYRFKLNFYRDCDGVSAPTSPSIDISSSCFNQQLTLNQDTVFEVSQTCPTASSTCQGGSLPGLENYTYSGTITLDTTCSDYSVSYDLCCRNDAICNLQNPGSQSLFVDVTLDPTICNNSPFFTTNPIPFVCTNSLINYNHGAIDPEGDSLAYSLVNPLDDANTPIAYQGGFSPTNPLPTTGGFNFNNQTGQMSFTPTTPCNNVVTVLVEEFRNGQLIGSIKRDMQVVVINCTNNQPAIVDSIDNLQGGTLVQNNNIEVCPGDTVSFDIQAFDPDAGDIINMTSNVNLSIPGANFNVTGNPNDTLTGSFSWTPTAFDTSNNVFTVTITDNSCPIEGKQTFSFNIFVLDGTEATPSDAAYCPAGGPIEVNVVGGNQFSWRPDSGIVNASNDSSKVFFAPSAPTTYFIKSDLSATCKNKDTIFIDRVPDFIESVNPSPADTICLGQSSQLRVNINPVDTIFQPFNYQWTSGSSLNNDTLRNPLASPDSTTEYFVDVTSDTGCTIRDSVTVVLQGQAPFVEIQAPSGLCEDDTTQITAFTCQGEALEDDFDPGIDNSMWSNLTSVAASANCGSVSGSNALWFDGPIGPPMRQAATVDLVTTGGGTLDFYLKEGTGGACETPDAGDELSLEYSNNGGATWTNIRTFQIGNFPTFTFIQEPLPPAAQTPSTRFRWIQANSAGTGFDNWAIDDVSYQCCGTGCGTFTYDWTPGAGLSDSTIKDPDFFADTTRTYVVAVTPMGTNCTTFDTVTLQVSPDFNFSISDADTICNGQTSQLLAQGDSSAQPFTYDWTPANSLNDSSLANPIASPSVTTTYQVAITSQGGCTNRDSVRINVSGQAPTVDIQGNSTLCNGDTNQLAVEVCAGSALFDDFDPDVDNSQWTSLSGVAASPNCGSVSGSNALWFDAAGTREAITIDVNTTGGGNIEFYLIEGTGFTCESPDAGEELVLEYSINNGFTWNNINTYNTGNFPNFTFISEALPAGAQSSSTRFRFRQLGSSGSGSDNWAIDDVFYQCCGSQCGTFTYNWTPGTGISDSTIRNPIFFPDSTTTYIVGVTPQGTNCTQFDTVTVEVVPDFNFTVGPNDTICRFANTDLFANGLDSTQAPYSYNWSPAVGLQDTNMVNDQAPTAEPDTTTTFTVEIKSDSSGCINTAQQTVTVSGEAPRIRLNTDANNVCPGDSVNLTANVFQLSCGPSLSSCQTTPQIVQVGSSTSQGFGTPFNGSDEDSRYQVLFTQSELSAGGLNPGTILQLFLDVNTNGSTGQYENFTIKMGCTNDPELSTSNGWITGLTTVFTPKTITANSGFNNVFTLDTPYDWDGTSNLVIEICYDNPANNAPGGDDLLNTRSVGYNAALSASDNFTSGCSLPVSQAQVFSELPNIRFRICDPPPLNFTFNWTPSGSLSEPDSLQTGAIIDSTTTYELFIDDGQCTNTGEITVNIDTSFDVQGGPDTLLCTNTGQDSIQLTSTITGQPPTSNLNCGTNGTTCSTTPTTTQIGTGSGSTGIGTPYKGFWQDGRAQYLIRASELQAQGLSAGTITEIAFNVITKNSTQPYSGFTIQMGCTSLNTLPTNGFASAPLSTVLGPVSYTTTAGINTHTLTNTFDWDGTSNLIIEVCFDNTSFTGDDDIAFTTTPFNSVLHDFTDNATGCTLANPTVSQDRPNILFTMCQAPTGNPTIQWSPSNLVSNDTIANPKGFIGGATSSEFIVSYSFPNGCVKDDTVNVTTTNFQNTVTNDTSICFGDSVQLATAGQANQFTWSPDTSLSCTDCPNPVAFPDTVTTYQVLLEDTITGCTQIQNVTVDFRPGPSITPMASNPNAICPGQTTTIGVQDNGNTFVWSTNQTGNTTTVSQPGAYTVTATDPATGCTNTATINLGLNVPPEVEFLPSNPDSVCPGDTFEIGVRDIYEEYLWSTGDTTPRTMYDMAGYVNVTVTDSNGCSSSDSTFVNFISKPQPVITPSVVNCANGDFPDTLSVMQNFMSYMWSTGDTTQATIIDSNATYAVTVTDTNGCTGTSTANAQIGAVGVDLTAEDTAIIIDENTTLTATPNGGVAPFTYIWDNNNLDEDVSGETGSTITVAPQENTTYQVTVIDNDSCTATDTVFVNVEDEPGIVVPEAFSPNGDGRNDLLRPLTKGPVTISDFRIFNRWGEEVFRMNGNSNQGWDGEMDGNEQPVGTYVYYLIYIEDGEEKKESGSISLVR